MHTVDRIEANIRRASQQGPSYLFLNVKSQLTYLRLPDLGPGSFIEPFTVEKSGAVKYHLGQVPLSSGPLDKIHLDPPRLASFSRLSISEANSLISPKGAFSMARSSLTWASRPGRPF